MKFIVFDNVQIYQKKCPYCNCNFIFTEDETQHFTSKYSGYYNIHCPNCKLSISMNGLEMQRIV